MFYVDFEAVDEYLSHYQSSDVPDMVLVEADAGASSEVSTSLILPRVKLHTPSLRSSRLSTPLRSGATHGTPRRAYSTSQSAAMIPSSTLSASSTVTTRYYRVSRRWSTTSARPEALEIAHCAYGDPSGVMTDIGHSSPAGFDRTQLPVSYYRVNISHAQELPDEADPRSAGFCCDVRDCGAKFQTLVEEVPKIGRKLRSLVVAKKG
ncbi:hypothetical protein EDB86DRAFT_3079272 [Lactarius hatsudake]|nr:hypothetical protein EDB86DRAFT_3079272 [Lactarius hatsudake]